MMAKLRAGKKLEYGVFVLFISLYCVVSAFHEPWFDEAQAWQIAKCASLRELFFEVPHYEGHPPLWWLILAIPAKLGIPFEIGLKSIGFLISVSSVFLILFLLPYPRLMRLLLPLSYFVFYQYGIIVRPYGLMMLAFLLLALAFPSRDRHPWRFTGLLLLLCLTSAYGIVMAGGIAICMVWELIQEKGLGGFIRGLWKDSRTLALGVLLAVAVLLILEIMPRDNTFVASKDANNSFALCLLCALFTFFGECTLTTSSWFSEDSMLLQQVYISKTELIIFCLIGILLWLFLVGASSMRSLKYLLIPYGLFAVFAAMVYFGVHHVGVVLLFLLFWTGILLQDADRFEIGRSIVDIIVQKETDRKLLRNATLAVCLVCLLVPIYWTVRSSISDIQFEYSYGRESSRYLKEHHLENRSYFSAWLDGSTDEELPSSEVVQNTFYVSAPVLLNAYFDHNICYNLNYGNDDEAYMHYKLASDSENAEAISAWRKRGLPEILLGKPAMNIVFEDFNYDDYSIIRLMDIHYIWKDSVTRQLVPIYARNDVVEECGLEVIDDPALFGLLDGLQITEEMREAFENGVPVEEILKPYLDKMFGEEDG